MHNYKIVLLCFIFTVVKVCKGQPRKIAYNCWWKAREKQIYCMLTRFDGILTTLEVPSDTKQISCKHCSIRNATNFKIKVLEKTKNLEVAQLAYNYLSQLTPHFFSANKKLVEINMRNNKLQIIPPNLFQDHGIYSSANHLLAVIAQHQVNLKKLDLSNNMISSISPRLFTNTPKLEILEMWNNRLEALPEDLFRTTKKLEKLSLSNNKLSSLPETVFAGMKSLKYLFMYRNEIRCLSPHIFNQLTNIEMIHLGYNNIKTLPGEIFSSNPLLKSIRLWANLLECIPKNLFDNNIKLRDANFLLRNTKLTWGLRQRFSNRQRYNNIRDLRRKLKQLGSDSCEGQLCDWDPASSILDCSNRNLSTLVELSDVCGVVRHVKLNGNRLNDSAGVAKLFERYPQIRALELQENQFGGELDRSIFRNAEYLEFVDLSDNFIDKLPQDLFHTNILLQEVWVRGNFISNLTSEIFKENDALERIDLSSNHLHDLPQQLLDRNSALVDIDLSRNYINTVENNIFKNNIKLRSVDLSDNQLNGRLDLSSLNHATDLTFLKLNGNRIKEIIYEVSNQERLLQNQSQELSLFMNRLNEVPLQLLRASTSVERIQMQRNEISTLPENAFFSNSRLKSINLSHNRVRSLNSGVFRHNDELEEVILDGNSLKELPASLLHNNKHLRIFSATGNRLRYIAVNTFWKNPDLHEVWLSNNQLGVSGIPGNLLAGNPHLTLVSLGGNSLTSLPKALFQAASRLSQLYLQKNNLESVNTSTFQTQPGSSDQSLFNHVSIQETEELLEKHLSQHENEQKLLSKITKIDLRGNPRLIQDGIGTLFTGNNVKKFFEKLTKTK